MIHCCLDLGMATEFLPHGGHHHVHVVPGAPLLSSHIGLGARLGNVMLHAHVVDKNGKSINACAFGWCFVAVFYEDK